MPESAAFEAALAHFDAGDFAAAQATLRSLLQKQPGHVRAIHLLAVCLAAQNHAAEAEQQFRLALSLAPQFSECYRNLALLLHRTGRNTEAVALLDFASEKIPQEAEFELQAAAILQNQADSAEALSRLKLALQKAPNSDRVHYALGVIYKQVQQHDLAVRHLTLSLQLNPKLVDAWDYLGGVRCDMGQFETATEAFEQALRLQPNSAKLHSHLGHVWLKRGRYDLAVNEYRTSLQLCPQDAESYFNLGNALSRLGQYSASEEAFQRCLQLRASHALAWDGLAGVRLARGDVGEAVACYRKSLAAQSDASVHSNLLYALHMGFPEDPTEDLQEHCEFERLHMPQPLVQKVRQPDGSEPIRIGFVSPDFRRHSVAYFFEPIAEHLDRERFEIYCYHLDWTEDSVTLRLKELATNWRNVAGQSEESIAQLIQHDRLDVLVDLAGHTGSNKIRIFGFRAAPTQVTYLGYSGTTGIGEIDYLLTDRLADPPGTQAHNSETLLYLPDSYFCYRPPDAAPPVAPAPYAAAGAITFGSFNNRSKLSRFILEVWAQILLAVPDARIVLKNDALLDRQTRETLWCQFERWGIERARVELLSMKPSVEEHLATYAQIDIALDSFPYNGATTTCESLWMGVPVISLSGQRHVSRMGASILTAGGYADWVHDDVREYIRSAVRFAERRHELQGVRAAMRQQLLASPLMREKQFVDNFSGVIEAAVRSSKR